MKIVEPHISAAIEHASPQRFGRHVDGAHGQPRLRRRGHALAVGDFGASEPDRKRYCNERFAGRESLICRFFG
jgi:hypothetical protein